MAKRKAQKKQKKTTAKKRKARGKSQSEDHGKKDIQDQLAQLKGWNDAEDLGDSFGEVPDGRYQFKIKEARVNNSDSSGRLQVSWDLEVINGEFAGRHVFEHDGLETDQNRDFFRTKLARIGLEWPENPADLPTVLEEALETYVEARVKTKGEFQNVRFVKALDNDEVEEESPDDDLKIGDTVMAPFDGELYEATIIGADEDTATVKFLDDDTEEKIPWDDLENVSSEKEEDSEPEEPEEVEEEPTELVCNFDDDDLKKTHVTKIKKLAKQEDFDPDDYETWTDLLADIAETVGVVGEFDDPVEVLKAIEEGSSE